MSEADIHFEFYRHLQNAIDDQPTREGITFGDVTPEYSEGTDGFADLVVFDGNGEPIVVIEAKSPDDDRLRWNTDPYSPKVIRQAFRYAGDIGAPYFCTFNGDRLVVFNAYEEGVPLLQRSTKSYEIASPEKFADTFLDEIGRIKAGDAKWDSNDDAFIDRVRALHKQITPQLESSLATHLNESEDFRESFHGWTATQGIEYESADGDERGEIHEEFAEQAAYLLINKIIFYKILEDSPTYGDRVRSLEVRSFNLRDDLDDCFGHLVNEVDFEAIYEHDEIYSEIPLDPVAERVQDFIEELDEQNLQQFDSDVIGRIYEGVIPSDRRHEMGEYYTPPEICDLITRLTIRDADDEVLDPSCGSGGFLVSAYHRKQDLLAEPQGSHDRVINQLYGVDINRFPAHLSAINLAIQDLSSYTDQVNIEVNDFFNVAPDTQRFERERAGAGGETVEQGVIEAVGGMNAVVGNPPYIRQENIDDKERVRNHLSRLDGDHLSKRSDIYAYFLTHATEFLDEGGRLGFITSDRWLDTGYGADLQEFILDNYVVEAVIKFSRQTFEDALVGACVLVLRKESDASVRDENVSKFVRVNESLDVDAIESVVTDEAEPNQMVKTGDYRLVTRRQQSLREEEKWSVFFNAPPIYFDTVGYEDTIQLEEVAEVTRGFTSGANDFYFGRTEEWQELGLKDYAGPLLKATGQVERISFDEEAAGEWGFLSVHDLVEQAMSESANGYEDIQVEETIKTWLSDNGHESLVEYIEWGEEQGYRDRPTTSARDVWFDLGELNPPPILMTDFTWREHRVVWNGIDALGSNQFYYIVPESDIDERVLCGILNSRLTWLMCELKGRWAEGQGMARSRLMVYETEQLPILDPRGLTEEQKELIGERFDALMKREKELGDEASVEKTESERDELDRAVLSAVGMDDRLEELKDAVERMVKMREQAAGEATEVLVDRPEETEIIELEGVSQARESMTLDDF